MTYLFKFIGKQVLCGKCLKCLTIQYWPPVDVSVIQIYDNITHYIYIIHNIIHDVNKTRWPSMTSMITVLVDNGV